MEEDDGGFSTIIENKSKRQQKEPTTNTRLASLFSNDLAEKSIGNTSLSYKPVKQNTVKNVEPVISPVKADTMKLIHACPIILFLYDLNNPIPIEKGKRGTALLSNNNKMASLLVYEPTSKQQDVNLLITNKFNFTVTSDLYFIMFYDQNNIQWALRFDNTDSTVLYIRYLILLKESVRDISESNNLLYQDLIIGNAIRSINIGDTVKLSYTMYLLTDTSPKTISTMVGTIPIEKPKTVKLGDKKEILGIEEGLIGMKKLSSRFLIIPPEKAYGSVGGGAIPSNSWVGVEMTVVKVKFADEDANTTSSINVVQPVQSTQPVSEPVDTERSGSSDQKASDLKLRMAKLAGGKSLFDSGSDIAIQKDKTNLVNAYAVSSFKQDELFSQATLNGPISNPVSTANPVHEDVVITQKEDLPHSHHQHSSQLNNNNTLNSIQSPVHINQNQQYPQQPLNMNQQNYGVQYTPYMQQPNGYHYYNNGYQSQNINEEKDSRNYNTALNEKLDKILCSIEKISTSDSSSLSPANIIASLQNLSAEKEKMKVENSEANEKIHILQLKISELHEKNRKSLEENTKLIEKQFSTMQSDAELRQFQVQELQQKLMNQLQLHQTDLSDKTTKIVNLQSDLQKETRIKLDLEQELFTSKAELADLQARITMINDDLFNKSSQISKLKADIRDKEITNKVNEDETDSSKLESVKIDLENTKQELARLFNELKKENALRSDAEKKAYNLSSDCDKLKDEINHLKSDLAQNENLNKSYDSIKLNLEQQIETFQSQLADAQKSSVMLSTQFELEKSALSSISSNNLIEAQENASRLAAEKSELETALEHAKVKELRFIESAKLRIESLTDRLAESEAEKSDIITQSKEFKVKLKAQSSEERKELLQSAMNYLYTTVAKAFENNFEVKDKLKGTIKNVTLKILNNPDNFDFENDDTQETDVISSSDTATIELQNDTNEKKPEFFGSFAGTQETTISFDEPLSDTSLSIENSIDNKLNDDKFEEAIQEDFATTSIQVEVSGLDDNAAIKKQKSKAKKKK